MALRTFRDADGSLWQAWDTLPEKIVSNTLEGGWLTFQREGEKRRLAPIPLYWANASDDELRVLLVGGAAAEADAERTEGPRH